MEINTKNLYNSLGEPTASLLHGPNLTARRREVNRNCEETLKNGFCCREALGLTGQLRQTEWLTQIWRQFPGVNRWESMEAEGWTVFTGLCALMDLRVWEEKGLKSHIAEWDAHPLKPHRQPASYHSIPDTCLVAWRTLKAACSQDPCRFSKGFLKCCLGNWSSLDISMGSNGRQVSSERFPLQWVVKLKKSDH